MIYLEIYFGGMEVNVGFGLEKLRKSIEKVTTYYKVYGYPDRSRFLSVCSVLVFCSSKWKVLSRLSAANIFPMRK